MKTLLTLLIFVMGFSAQAQRPSYSKEVTTDGQQLRIRVVIEQSGRSIHYSRSFDVSEMDARAVKALESRILDSLDQSFDGRYAGLFSERKREDQYRNKHHKEADAVVRADAGKTEEHSEPMQAHASRDLSPSDVAPSSVLHREDKENGRLWMQYVFKKDGNELVFERTANVTGKTEREKQAIIKDTERSLGIKPVAQ